MRSSRCPRRASGWRRCGAPPRPPAMPRCWRASATTAASSTSSPCWRPRSRCSSRRTAWPMRRPTIGVAHVHLYKALGGGWQPESAALRVAGHPRLAADAGHLGESTLMNAPDRHRLAAQPRRRAGSARTRLDDSARRTVASPLALDRRRAGAWPWPRARGCGGRGSRPRAAPSYVTEAVTRGNLSITVTANGTLQPTRSVSIGSELSGTVTRVLVDVNDRVKKGQVLVELDTAKFARPGRPLARDAGSAHGESRADGRHRQGSRRAISRASRKSRACPAARCRRRPSSTPRRPRSSARRPTKRRRARP